jgi:tetratricopeptide (TPR) repeat protein
MKWKEWWALVLFGLCIAVFSFADVVRRASPSALSYYRQGRTAFGARDYETALEHFTHAIELDPDYAEAYIQRGYVNWYLEKDEQALADYNLALELTPTDTAIYELRGRVYHRLGEYERALADLTHAIGLDPTFASAYLTRGILFVALEQPEAAGRDFYRRLTLKQQHSTDLITLTLGEPFTVEMQENHLYNVPFEAEAGQTITVTANDADDSGVDPLIVILDADGNALIGDDDNGEGLNALISDFQIPTDGTYTLVIGHAGQGSEGTVEVTLEIGVE